ncbi:MAG: c-type cytochrome [bacterium]
MEFLKHLALPQSTEHFHLLLLISGLLSLVFIPYLAFLGGSSILSYAYNRKGTREGNKLYLRFAKDLIDIPLTNKLIPTFLGIIPAFSLMFIYAQLFQLTDAIVVSLAGFGFILFLAATILLSSYRYTFRLHDLLEVLGNSLAKGKGMGKEALEIEEYRKQNSSVHAKTGRWGVVTIVLATLLFTSATTVAVNRENWIAIDSIFAAILAIDVWLRFILFIAFSAGITGIGILFFLFAWRTKSFETGSEYAMLVRRLTLRLTTGSLLIQPLLILVTVFLLPQTSLSGLLFMLAGVTIVLLFLAAHFLYAYSGDSQVSRVSSAFFIFGFAAACSVMNDQVMMYNATRTHASILTYRHDLLTEELKAKLGIASVALTGEDIFNAKCSACHQFDQKKVGPAYKDVLPKYAGKKAQLISFVLNPVKINPAYPSMPAQGLKPSEADSIITYLLAKVGVQNPQKDSTSVPSK